MNCLIHLNEFHTHRCFLTEGWSGTTHPLFYGDPVYINLVISRGGDVERISSLSFNTYKLVFNQLTSFAVEHVFKMGCVTSTPTCVVTYEPPKDEQNNAKCNFFLKVFEQNNKSVDFIFNSHF
jgi:hypothetical protein